MRSSSLLRVLEDPSFPAYRTNWVTRVQMAASMMVCAETWNINERRRENVNKAAKSKMKIALVRLAVVSPVEMLRGLLRQVPRTVSHNFDHHISKYIYI